MYPGGGGITLYRSYATYQEEKSFNVLKGKVPSFTSNDLELAVMVDGEYSTTIPEAGNYLVTVTCDNGATGEWNYSEWGPNIRNITAPKTKCSLDFVTSTDIPEDTNDFNFSVPTSLNWVTLYSSSDGTGDTGYNKTCSAIKGHMYIVVGNFNSTYLKSVDGCRVISRKVLTNSNSFVWIIEATADTFAVHSNYGFVYYFAYADLTPEQ